MSAIWNRNLARNGASPSDEHCSSLPANNPNPYGISTVAQTKAEARSQRWPCRTIGVPIVIYVLVLLSRAVKPSSSKPPVRTRQAEV
ncbi:hypothetical protein BDW67DRAFT_154759 [Aspergillus spinulosporus]